jgi:xanthine dehydrogenase YagR molybdenum-binding subunit
VARANVQTSSACEVRILRDGSVEVLSSVQDIGTGIGTVLAQVVAEELRLQPDDITRCALATPNSRLARRPMAV